jgi:hypothetical protein
VVLEDADSSVMVDIRSIIPAIRLYLRKTNFLLKPTHFKCIENLFDIDISASKTRDNDESGQLVKTQAKCSQRQLHKNAAAS